MSLRKLSEEIALIPADKIAFQCGKADFVRKLHHRSREFFELFI